MDSSLVEYRPVDALAAPSEQLMRVIIERARVNPLASSYVNSPDGLGRFFQDFYRPLATALNNAFPGSAAFPTDVPVATREAMIPFVGKLFEWSVSGPSPIISHLAELFLARLLRTRSALRSPRIPKRRSLPLRRLSFRFA